MTPKKLNALAKTIEKLRLDLLFGPDSMRWKLSDGAPEGGWVGCPLAEQSFLLALTNLEQALTNLEQAYYHLRTAEIQQRNDLKVVGGK